MQSQWGEDFAHKYKKPHVATGEQNPSVRAPGNIELGQAAWGYRAALATVLGQEGF